MTAQHELNIIVSNDRICIDDAVFVAPCGAERFQAVLGTPSRVDAGKPAPVGFRNNQVWFFDDLGVFLLEHHKSAEINCIGIVLDAESAYRKPRSPFTGNLSIFGTELRRNMTAEDFQQNCNVQFRWHLGHSLVVDFETLAIDIDTHAIKKRGSRQFWKRLINAVAIELRSAASIKVHQAYLQEVADRKKWENLFNDSAS